MDLKAFFMENVGEMGEEEIVVSDRFKNEKNEPVPFRVKAITEMENAEIRKSCQRRTRGKNGILNTETDIDLYLAKLVAACILYPDFKDAALQKSWGVLGADALLRRMLTAGEFSSLLASVQEVCGFDRTLDEVKDEIKNS